RLGRCVNADLIFLVLPQLRLSINIVRGDNAPSLGSREYGFNFVLGFSNKVQSPSSHVDPCHTQQVPTFRRAYAVDLLAVRRPARAVVLHVALVRGQMPRLAGRYLNRIDVLVEVRLHAMHEQPFVIWRPADRDVVAAWSFVEKMSLLFANGL